MSTSRVATHTPRCLQYIAGVSWGGEDMQDQADCSFDECYPDGSHVLDIADESSYGQDPLEILINQGA